MGTQCGLEGVQVYGAVWGGGRVCLADGVVVGGGEGPCAVGRGGETPPM